MVQLIIETSAVEAGFARRAPDIGRICVNGDGFAARRGGPMCDADCAGLDRVYLRACDFHREHGEFWTSARLLQCLVSEGHSFAKPD